MAKLLAGTTVGGRLVETIDGSQTKATLALTQAKAHTEQEISKLVNSAPGTLDTLSEIAKALANDHNFAATMTTELGKKANSTDVYTKTEISTGGLSSVHWGNIKNVPAYSLSTHVHDDRYNTKTEITTLLNAKADKSTILLGGTGITTAIGDLSGSRTISIDTTVARKNERSDGYHWFRHNATTAALITTQQGTGPIAEFRKGAGDGTALSAISADGSFTGNANTASTWQTKRTLSLTGNAAGSVAFDGSSNISLSVNVLDDSHEHTSIKSIDRRISAPRDFSTGKGDVKFLFTAIDNNSNAPYADAIVLSTYKDSSGGGVNMLAFDKDKASIYHRFGAWGAAAWENYRRIAYSDELRWGNIEGVPSDFKPSYHDHDDRYYLKTEITGFLSKKSDTTHNHTLDSLSNVIFGTKATGHLVRWNGSVWANSVLVAADIPALDTSKITTGVMNDARLPNATTSAKGTVQLSTAVNSTSTALAATASAVKTAYDKANHAHPYLSDSATSEQIVSGSTVHIRSTKSSSAFKVVFNDAENSLDFVLA